MPLKRDQRLWLWRLRDGQLALAPILHPDRINAVGFSPDGLLFWSGADRVFRAWEIATGDAAAPALRHLGAPPPPPPRSADGSLLPRYEEVVLRAWSGAGRIVSCDSRGGVNAWDLRSRTRPLDEMETLARILSMHRIESRGGLVPLTRDELRAAWGKTRSDTVGRK